MKHITVVFKNAIQIEGSLISLEDNEMVLQSLDGISSTVIPDIKDSILFYKVNSSKEEYDMMIDKPTRTRDDLEKIVRARGDLNDIERTSIKEKLHSPVMLITKDPYVPRNQSIQGPIQYSEKKTSRANPSFASGLQGMFKTRS